MSVFKLGELFCGPGGIAWGAVNAKCDNKDFRIERAYSPVLLELNMKQNQKL